jgi:hypothetical protein
MLLRGKADIVGFHVASEKHVWISSWSYWFGGSDGF